MALTTLQFGSGSIFAAPSGGNVVANPTPQEIGVIQSVKLTLGADIKELYGQLQYPVDTAIGKRSIKGSFEHAQISGALWNNCFFSDVQSTGSVTTTIQEAHNIPATGPYTVSVTQSTFWINDQGVMYASTGFPLTLIPTGTPSAGQYLVSNGVYTFAAADEGSAILISYRWTSAGVGNSYQINNHQMGWGPIISLNLLWTYQGNYQGLYLPNARLGKIDLSNKLDDYSMGSTDFSAFANPSGLVGTYYLPD